jgi:hypothetical protein
VAILVAGHLGGPLLVALKAIAVATALGAIPAYTFATAAVRRVLVAVPFILVLVTPLNPLVPPVAGPVALHLGFLILPALALAVGLLIAIPVAGLGLILGRYAR